MARSGKSKRRDLGEEDPRKSRPHDWQKDEEEIDLEAKLFGASRVKKGKSKSKEAVADEAVDGHFGELDDDDDVSFFRRPLCV